MSMHDEKTIARFMAKVEKQDSGCWIWVGGRNPNGYGNFGIGGHGKVRAAHRVSYEMFVGPIPTGLFICHTCDTPACVNPEHLFPGTNSDNMRDAWQKGRMPAPTPPTISRARLREIRLGELNPAAKLTNAQAREIRVRFESGETNMSALGREFGVTSTSISFVVKRKTFAEV